MRKKTAYLWLSILLATSVCYAGNPFDDEKITVNNTSNSSSLETADINIKEDTSSAKNDTAEDNKTTEYTVQTGDYLFKIAKEVLGDSSRWPEIVELNKDKYPSLITNPALIYAGWVLTLPGGSSGSTTNTTASSSDIVSTDTGSESNSTVVNDVGLSNYTGVTKAIFDIVQKFCDANEAYVFGSAHYKTNDYVKTSDCSGFTAQFVNKLSELAGVSSALGSDYPTSTNFANSKYTQPITKEFPPTNPRDLIKPGDIFVMGPGAGYTCGHVGVFMGYNSAGQPLIAHSTGSATSANAVMGKIGKSGVRVEVLTYSDQIRQRGWGMYRLNNMNQIVNNLNNI